MSLVPSLKNIRITTKLAISALVTLLAVIYMAITYTEYIELEEGFVNKRAALKEFNQLIESVDSNIQWADRYEKDLLLEQALGKGIVAVSKLSSGNSDLYQRVKDHLGAAQRLTSRLYGYVRKPEDRKVIDSLDKWIAKRIKKLSKYEKNPEGSGLRTELSSLVTENNQVLRSMLEGGKANAQQSKNILIELEQLEKRLEQHQETVRKMAPTLSSVLKIHNVEDLVIGYYEDDLRANNLAKEENLATYYTAIGLVIAALVLNAIIFNVSILHPLDRIMKTIKNVREGDDQARSKLNSNDELGHLGQVLDNLLDEKNHTFAVQEEQKNALNASVITLIQNVFQLSQRDLSVRVPVAEDVTGAVSDSINQLAESIEDTLKQVIGVSERVNMASTQIQSQSENVRSHTSKEQEEISETLQGLESVIKAMQIIAKLATASHGNSKQAIVSSESAMTSVSETIDSINKIRQSIQEAEKRIKRLGERSQEIGGIVGLINNISERTHILSLNAGMHAASAGEAGRGLMVVVDEVQRLAENSREATAEIETLVGNIQLETSDTIEVMNKVISDVVDGTRLAEEAGARMSETRETTDTLVESVVRIAKSAVSQAKVATNLRDRANKINESTNVTSAEMLLQSELSEQLVKAADDLQQSVRVFKLTAA